MTLKEPFKISSRLLPCVQIGNASISIELGKQTPSGRIRYRYYIDTPDFEYDNDDLKSGVDGGSLQGGMESLLCFLSAAAEAYRYNGCQCCDDNLDDNCSLFPPHVTEWAYQNSDGISMLQLELSETPNLIES